MKENPEQEVRSVGSAHDTLWGCWTDPTQYSNERNPERDNSSSAYTEKFLYYLKYWICPASFVSTITHSQIFST